MLIIALLVIALLLIKSMSKKTTKEIKEFKENLNEKIPTSDNDKRKNLNKHGVECTPPD